MDDGVIAARGMRSGSHSADVRKASIATVNMI
jgi:hypothetical protein